jgi:hypothetical protein
MKNFEVVMVYTAYQYYEVEAKDKNEAMEQAWYKFEKNPLDSSYGEWSITEVEEK